MFQSLNLKETDDQSLVISFPEKSSERHSECRRNLMYTQDQPSSDHNQRIILKKSLPAHKESHKITNPSQSLSKSATMKTMKKKTLKICR